MTFNANFFYHLNQRAVDLICNSEFSTAAQLLQEGLQQFDDFYSNQDERSVSLVEEDDDEEESSLSHSGDELVVAVSTGNYDDYSSPFTYFGGAFVQ